jgi:ElaB/YqjD/DUF883 family membrane-anchored ribosome-binding protein
VSDDLHASTSAGPEPTPVVGPSEATATQPAGSAASGDGSEGGVGAKASQAAGQAQQKATEVAGQAQEKATQVAGQAQELTSERPEILVGAAFAGGFVAAMILKRLGR